MYDIVELRKDFPFLTTNSNKHPLVYLDNAASSVKPRQVIEAERKYYEEYGVNIHRGLYAASARATRMFQDVREKTAAFIGAKDARSIIFTRGSTESSNLLAYSWASTHLGEEDVVLTTQLEHHSTLVPWQEACKRQKAKLRFIPWDSSSGELSSSLDWTSLLQNTKIVVVSGMTNATGYILPIQTIIKEAHARGIPVAIDGAQLVAHTPIDVSTLDCDFLYFSAHKMLGPTGVGILYGKLHHLEAMEPFLFGGDMIAVVDDLESTWAEVPEKFEAGTPNIAGVLGFGVALDYLTNIGMSSIQEHETLLAQYAFDCAEAFEGLDIYGPKNRDLMGGILSCNLRGIHSHDTGTILDAQGIAVRTGFHCAMPYMKLLGISGSVRASMYFYNTKAEIDRLFEGLIQARTIFS